MTAHADGSHSQLCLQVLKLLYDKEVVGEEAILAWADEKEQAEAHERIFLKRCVAACMPRLAAAAVLRIWLRTGDLDRDCLAELSHPLSAAASGSAMQCVLPCCMLSCWLILWAGSWQSLARLWALAQCCRQHPELFGA